MLGVAYVLLPQTLPADCRSGDTAAARALSQYWPVRPGTVGEVSGLMSEASVAVVGWVAAVGGLAEPSDVPDREQAAQVRVAEAVVGLALEGGDVVGA